MVFRKQLLVLANSFKNGGRCIAGREVVTGGHTTRFGQWLRPVSGHGEGELDDLERRYRDHTYVDVLEVAEVELVEPIQDPCQPENWRIAGRSLWDHGPPLTKLLVVPEERPDDLWYDPMNDTDRVSHAWLMAHPPRQSLYVVRPEQFLLRFYTEQWSGYPRTKRRRCLFYYKRSVL